MKWTQFNLDYKKFSNYHKGTKHHSSFWKLTTNEHDKCHLPWSFNKDNYDVSETFQKEHIINVPLHLKDLQFEDDKNYITIILYLKLICKLCITTIIHTRNSWQGFHDKWNSSNETTFNECHQVVKWFCS